MHMKRSTLSFIGLISFSLINGYAQAQTCTPTPTPTCPPPTPTPTCSQGTTLSVNKTATANLTQTDTYSWTVQKTTPPNQVTYVASSGHSVPVNFTITATRTGPTTSYSEIISGNVCVKNTGAVTTQGLQITDTLQYLNGATWTPVPGAQIVIPISSEIPPGPNPVCYPYQITGLTLNPELQYRNLATVSITNYLDHEGSPYSVQATASVTIGTPVVNTIDATATLVDLNSCPAGFSCSINSSTPLPTDLSSSSSIFYTVTATNTSASCGQTLTLMNQAILTPDTTHTPQNAFASSQIYTGTCRDLDLRNPARLSSGFEEKETDSWKQLLLNPTPPWHASR